jgi:hypothetical protein
MMRRRGRTSSDELLRNVTADKVTRDTFHDPRNHRGKIEQTIVEIEL